jgi:hypothetical protein
VLLAPGDGGVPALRTGGLPDLGGVRLYSYRDLDETVLRVEGGDEPYLQVGGYSYEDGEVSAGTLAPEFFCRSCGCRYTRAEGFEIDWGS